MDELSSRINGGIVSEVLLVDWQHEGEFNGFDIELVTQFPDIGIPLIVFGGLSEASKIEILLKMARVKSAGVGNFLNYTEHSVQTYKKHLNSGFLRHSAYQNRIGSTEAESLEEYLLRAEGGQGEER